MQHWLTPDYYHWTMMIDSVSELNDPRYCSGSEILCTQDWNDEQILNAPVKLIAIDKTTAKLTLTCSIMHKFEDAYQLTVALKVVKGQWRIDGVTIQDL